MLHDHRRARPAGVAGGRRGCRAVGRSGHPPPVMHPGSRPPATLRTGAPAAATNQRTRAPIAVVCIINRLAIYPSMGAVARSAKTARVQCIGDRARRDSAVRPELIDHRSNVRSEPVSRGACRFAALGAVIQHLPGTVPAPLCPLAKQHASLASVFIRHRHPKMAPIKRASCSGHALDQMGVAILSFHLLVCARVARPVECGLA